MVALAPHARNLSEAERFLRAQIDGHANLAVAASRAEGIPESVRNVSVFLFEQLR